MSAKRPRPAVPVLVHVDNPAEVGSVTVDTSTIEGKMDTVITNQNRIYDKIPTSTGGSSADLTTVNEKTTALAETIGPVDSNIASNNLFGAVKNLSASVGDFNSTPSNTGTSVRSFLYSLRQAIGPADSSLVSNNIFGSVRNLRAAVGDSTSTPSIDGTDLRSLLYNVREAVGYSSTSPTSSGTSIRNKLATIDTNTTTMKNMIGTSNSVTADTSLIGATRNLVATMGKFGTQMNVDDTTIRGFLYNMRNSIGSVSSAPTTTGTTVRDLLTAIKENTASGGGGGSADLTTVNEKTTALATAIGSASDDSSTVSVIGLLKSITDKY